MHETAYVLETATDLNLQSAEMVYSDFDQSYLKAQEFFYSIRRSCCPERFPGYTPRNSNILKIMGAHTIPDPQLPFWWSESVVNSKQALSNPWLRELLLKVTWREMMEGIISNAKFKEARQNWSADQRKLISSPKIGGILNFLFICEPDQVLRFRNRATEADRFPLWWYWIVALSVSYSGIPVARFLMQTTHEEYKSGAFNTERLRIFCEQNKRKQPNSESIETFLRNTFSEFPQVITRFNQRGSRANYIMRVTADPFSIVTMSSRSPHWTSCQNPIQDDTHEMSHRLWANLLDPNMALLEMIDPSIDENLNLVARAILRIVKDNRRDLLYLDCLYGERGYITSFVSLSRQLAQEADLIPVSGRMIPFYTSFNTSLEGIPIDFADYEPPYLDLGEWRRDGKMMHFSGQGHYIVENSM